MHEWRGLQKTQAKQHKLNSLTCSTQPWTAETGRSAKHALLSYAYNYFLHLEAITAGQPETCKLSVQKVLSRWQLTTQNPQKGNFCRFEPSGPMHGKPPAFGTAPSRTFNEVLVRMGRSTAGRADGWLLKAEQQLEGCAP